MIIMPLEAYHKKRKFSGKGKTSEPKGRIKAEGKSLIFVIHKHHASHLHWDLRLEMDGVLKSWAVPKEPPINKGIKRLAVHVEDHPIEYAKFRGIIPEGNYGAGKVEIWDKGKYVLLERSPKKIMFNLKGRKLKGNYILIKTRFGSKPGKSWLWFKV
jgi:bifunctional non-homologous end joining protein LigD